MQKKERERKGRREVRKKGRKEEREGGKRGRKKGRKMLKGNFWQETYRYSYVTQLEVTSSCSRCNRKDIITQQLTSFPEQTLSANHMKSIAAD